MGLAEKIATAIGLIAGSITIGGLIYQAMRTVEAEEVGIPITLRSEPVDIEFLVDGKPVRSGSLLRLSEGYHTFQTSPIGLDFLEEYDFYAWKVDGKITSYDTTLKWYIDRPTEIRAVYILSQYYPAPITFI